MIPLEMIQGNWETPRESSGLLLLVNAYCYEEAFWKHCLGPRQRTLSSDWWLWVAETIQLSQSVLTEDQEQQSLFHLGI